MIVTTYRVLIFNTHVFGLSACLCIYVVRYPYTYISISLSIYIEYISTGCGLCLRGIHSTAADSNRVNFAMYL